MNKKWFTLVELVVVVTILMILWVIWMLSFQWYSRDSRDSVRIQDISSMKKVLELFMLNKWFYPKPTNVSNITHSWWIVWSQWVFWNTVLENLWKINKVPLDPLYNIEYTYSVTWLKTEYELWWILEWWWTVFNKNLLLNKAMADEWYRALVEWNYNWQFTRVSTWWIDYILAIPWIIASDLSSLDIITIVNNSSIVYNNENNIPQGYKSIGSSWVWSWWFDYNPWTNLVVFSWELSSLWTSTWKIEFIEWLQKAYSGTKLASKDSFKKILSFDTKNEQSTVNNFVAEVFDSVPQFPKKLILNQTVWINWKCWDSHSKNFLQKPDNNLCSKWNATVVSWTWPWSWGCNWINNWDKANCSANLMLPSSNNIRLWLRADDLSSSFNNNDTISLWNWVTPHTYVIWEGTSKPVYKNNVTWVFWWNNSVVYFNWLWSYFNNHDYANIANSDHSIFIVAHPLTSWDDLTILSFNSPTWIDEEVYLVNTTGNISSFKEWSNSIIGGDNFFNKNILITSIRTPSTSTWYINWWNWVLINESFPINSSIFAIWLDYDIHKTIKNFFKWYMAEIILYNKALSNQEINKIKNYLYIKYDLN